MANMNQDREWTQKYTADLSAALEESRSPAAVTPRAGDKESGKTTTGGIPTPPGSSSPSSPRSPASPTSPRREKKIARRPVPETNPFRARAASSSSATNTTATTANAAAAAPSTRPPSYRTAVRSRGPSGEAPPAQQRRPPASSAPTSRPPHPSSSSKGRPDPRPSDRPAAMTGEGSSSSSSGRPRDRHSRQSRSVPRHGRHRRGHSHPDTIDALDTVGGGYHHEGPYEATLAARNLNPRYAPLAAVRDSNMEAIRATPREYIQDSLDRHVPLQGTATIPSGSPDLAGKVMTYEEGTDMMRYGSPGGGAYKRWDFLDYDPDDLKGKGEPSFSYDRARAKKREERGLLGPDDDDYDRYEMQQQQGRGHHRRHHHHRSADLQRSISSGAYDAHSSGLAGHPAHQQHAGGGFGSGLKRRLGSLRRKKDLPAEQVR